MPSFNFDRRFREPIALGLKTHTIRKVAPRGFQVGAWAPLYTGQRTHRCSLIGSGLMDRREDIRLDFDLGLVERGVAGFPLTDQADLDDFARRDGFSDWADMAEFWGEKHPGVRQFSGVLMGWSTLVFSHRLGAANPEPA